MRAAAASSLRSSRALKRRSHPSSAPGTRRLLPRSEGEAAAPPFSCPGSPVLLSGRVSVAPTFQTKLRLFHRSHQRMWPNSHLLFEVSTAELFSESESVVLMNGCRGGVAKNKVTAVGILRPAFSGKFCAGNVLYLEWLCVCVPSSLCPKGCLMRGVLRASLRGGWGRGRPHRRHLRLGWTASRARGTYVSLGETDISLVVDGSVSAVSFSQFQTFVGIPNFGA